MPNNDNHNQDLYSEPVNPQMEGVYKMTIEKEVPSKVCVCLRCKDPETGKPSQWVSHLLRRPKACPNCHSRKWDVPPKVQ